MKHLTSLIETRGILTTNAVDGNGNRAHVGLHFAR